MTTPSDSIASAAEEEPKSGGGQTSPQADSAKKLRPILTVGRANLTDEEIKSSGVMKMLVERFDDYETELTRLRPIENELSEVKADLRVTKAQLDDVKKRKLMFEIVSLAMAAAGSAMLSASKSLFAPEMLPYGVALALLLIGAALAAKIVQLWMK